MSPTVTGASRRRRIRFMGVGGWNFSPSDVGYPPRPARKCAGRGHPVRLDSPSNSLQRNDMLRTQLRVLFTVAVFGAAVGLAGRARTKLLATTSAVAAGTAVTPRTEIPNEARAVARLFQRRQG